jgi:hypothetical protein
VWIIGTSIHLLPRKPDVNVEISEPNEKLFSDVKEHDALVSKSTLVKTLDCGDKRDALVSKSTSVVTLDGGSGSEDMLVLSVI